MSVTEQPRAQGVLAGKTVVVTGDLVHFPESGPYPERIEFRELVESCGGKLVSSVSGKTSYLVCNDPNSGTVKARKAREKNVPILSEEEFLALLGDDRAAASGDSAFSGDEQPQQVTLPEDGMIIEDGHLVGYLGTDTEVVVPEGVTDIHYDPFHGNKNLTKVVLPDSINYIHIHAFEDCVNLKQILLPEKPVGIHPTAFEGCRGLADEKGFVIVRDRLFDYFGNDRVVVIPEGVRDIGMVFYGNPNITSVVLPDSLARYDSILYDATDPGTTLDTAAFRNCTNLERIHIPEGIRWIPSYFFKDCENLKELRLPDSVVGMDVNALDGCHSLRSVTGLNVTQIREVKAENPLCSRGGPPIMVCPKMSLSGVYKAALKESLTLGFFQNQELYSPEIAEEYRKYACRDRLYLLHNIFRRDIPEALAFYDAHKKINPKDFEKEWLEPAQKAEARGCIAWLLDWRSRHQPRKDPFELSL